MKIGAIVRTDMGGIAEQSRQIGSQIPPDCVLQVDLPVGARRGDSHPDRYLFGAECVDVCRTDVIPRDQLLRLARRVDVLWAVECFYCPDRTWAAINQECRTILIANPELYVNYPAETVVLPTSWEAHRIPGARVIPHPCDTRSVAARRRVRTGGVATFLHVQAPAMADRNGSNLVLAALPYVQEACTLVVRSFQAQRQSGFRGTRIGNVKIVWDYRRVIDWHEAYRDDIDVLVLPRRYGGLSLIVQECATLSIPSLMLDVDPQKAEAWPGWRIPAMTARVHPMRGGRFDVHDSDPRVLAAEMTALVRGERDLAGMSEAALVWSEDRSWDRIGDLWTDLLQP